MPSLFNVQTVQWNSHTKKIRPLIRVPDFYVGPYLHTADLSDQPLYIPDLGILKEQPTKYSRVVFMALSH